MKKKYIYIVVMLVFGFSISAFAHAWTDKDVIPPSPKAADKEKTNATEETKIHPNDLGVVTSKIDPMKVVPADKDEDTDTEQKSEAVNHPVVSKNDTSVAGVSASSTTPSSTDSLMPPEPGETMETETSSGTASAKQKKDTETTTKK